MSRHTVGYMKSKFYRAFNGLFHNAAKLKDELTTMHLVSSFIGVLYTMPVIRHRSCGSESNSEA